MAIFVFWPSLTSHRGKSFPAFTLSFGKFWRVWQKSLRRPRASLQSVFHPRERRTAFRRCDVRQQSRLFVLQDQWLRPSPNSSRVSWDCRRLFPSICPDARVRLTIWKWPDEKTAATSRNIQRHKSVASVRISIVSRERLTAG